jgi:DNA polymerase-3 subunit alpha
MAKLTCSCREDHDLDIEVMPLDCYETYAMIARSPLGIFQLEGPTAKKWIPKFRPATLEEISDFTSLARTGPLDAGMMQEYCDVKNDVKLPSYLAEKLKSILGPTKGTITYQEQVMRICSDIAGMTLSEADNVRKAIGKKLPEVMAASKDIFVNGCLKQGHSQEVADKLWSQIEVMTGYSFNKSHAICYSGLAYQMAWSKTHFTIEFFCSLLQFSGAGVKDQSEEISAIVNDMKLHDINILPPSLERGNIKFDIVSDREIAFGLGHIKGLGGAAAKSIKSFKPKNFGDFLVSAIEKKIKKNVVESLIWCGALDYMGVSRNKLSAAYYVICGLTEKEWEHLKPEIEAGRPVSTLVEDYATKDIEGRKAAGQKVPIKNRRDTLLSLLAEAKESIKAINFRSILAREKLLLGITISGNVTDLYGDEQVDNCIEFPDAQNNQRMVFLAEIESVRDHKDKNGNNMAFVKLGDSSYSIDSCVMFSSTYKKFGALLVEGNCVIVVGRKNDGSYLIDSVKVI